MNIERVIAYSILMVFGSYEAYTFASVYGFAPFGILISSLVYVSSMLLLLLPAKNWERNFMFSLLAFSILNVFINAATGLEFGTDEVAVSYYASGAILHGENPYTIPSYNYNSFVFSKMPYIYFVTPLRNQTITYTYDYPPLEAVFMIPAYFFHISPDLYNGIASLAIIPAIYVSYSLSGERRYIPYALLAIVITQSYFGMASGGSNDYMWVVTLILALAFMRKNIYISSILYGISIATKQDPWFLFPFLAVYNGKKSLKFVPVSIITFLAISSPFLIGNPTAFIRSVFFSLHAIPLGFSLSFLSVEKGIGYGSPMYFTVAYILSFTFYLLLYYKYGKKAGMSFLFFMPLIFLFFPRGLLNYFIFWFIIMASVAPAIPSYNGGIDKRVVAVSVILVLAICGFMFLPVHESSSNMIIEKVSLSNNLYMDGFSSMLITILNPNGRVYHIKFIRIITDKNSVAGNGWIWLAINGTIKPGLNNIYAVATSPKFLIKPGQHFTVLIEYGKSVSLYSMSAPRRMEEIPFVNPTTISFLTPTAYINWNMVSLNTSVTPSGYMVLEGRYGYIYSSLRVDRNTSRYAVSYGFKGYDANEGKIADLATGNGTIAVPCGVSIGFLLGNIHVFLSPSYKVETYILNDTIIYYVKPSGVYNISNLYYLLNNYGLDKYNGTIGVFVASCSGNYAKYLVKVREEG